MYFPGVGDRENLMGRYVRIGRIGMAGEIDRG